MSIFNWFSNLFVSAEAPTFTQYVEPINPENIINPANGLPMIGGMEGIDIEGNLFGTDALHGQHGFSESQDDWLHSSHSSFDDSFSSGCDNFGSSSFDDF
jgi:hypothetical protein